MSYVYIVPCSTPQPIYIPYSPPQTSAYNIIQRETIAKWRIAVTKALVWLQVIGLASSLSGLAVGS